MNVSVFPEPMQVRLTLTIPEAAVLTRLLGRLPVCRTDDLKEAKAGRDGLYRSLRQIPEVEMRSASCEFDGHLELKRGA